MSISRETIAGHELVRHHFPSLSEECGRLLHFHGQGDYASRYKDILAPFTEAGISCIVYDLPGHGESPGKRGHIPGIHIAEKIYVKEYSSNLFGLSGHSVGGSIALHLLQVSPHKPDFSWISSPLLNAAHRQASWKIALGKYLSYLFPSFTLSTGVKISDCVEDLEDEIDLSQFHSRISLSWARDLIELTQSLHPPLEQKHLLLTQGSKDPICPLATFEEFTQDLETELLIDSLHEPFLDPELCEILRKFVRTTIGVPNVDH